MAERLQRIATELQPQQNPYIVSARLDSALTLPLPRDPRDRAEFEARIAVTALHAGMIDDAIVQFDDVLADMDSLRDRVLLRTRPDILYQLANAHLWDWKEKNCLEGLGTRLCRVALDAEEEIRDRGPARSAIEIYTALLEAQPYNLEYRWLMNVAYMMAGEYPDGVPARWLIPPEAFRSEYELNRFPDVAPRLGLDVSGHAGGSIMDDFDNDGHLDVMTSSWHLTDPLRFFRNEGDGTFSDRSQDAGLGGVTGGLNLVQADYDNDGDLDVFVMRGAWLPYGEPSSLLRNDGEGRFDDVTESAGLLSINSTQAASWADYDNDGWLDLYIGYESRGERQSPNQLFHNNRDGTFTDVAMETGTAVVGFVKAAVWGDIDNDGRPDLYISRFREPNLLLRNQGPDGEGRWSFEDITESAGVAEPLASFPAWFWDYDNDGWLDIFVSGYEAGPAEVASEYLGLSHRGETPRLYRNIGGGRFLDVTASVGLGRISLAMGANYGDLDNDGYPDFYVGTGDMHLSSLVPNRMFRNADGVTFQEVTNSSDFGLLQKGHGVAFGDFDDDGDQDIYVNMGGAYEADLARNVLFENPGHGNHWITLALEGVRTNRSAIGARIRVSVDTPSGPRTIHALVSSGGSFGANSLQQEIGLGQATAIRSVEITWPTTGATDTFSNVELDRAYRVREGDKSLRGRR